MWRETPEDPYNREDSEENVLKREDDIPAASLIIRSVPFWLGMEQNWTFLQVRSTILGFH